MKNCCCKPSPSRLPVGNSFPFTVAFYQEVIEEGTQQKVPVSLADYDIRSVELYSDRGYRSLTPDYELSSGNAIIVYTHGDLPVGRYGIKVMLQNKASEEPYRFTAAPGELFEIVPYNSKAIITSPQDNPVIKAVIGAGTFVTADNKPTPGIVCGRMIPLDARIGMRYTVEQSLKFKIPYKYLLEKGVITIHRSWNVGYATEFEKEWFHIYSTEGSGTRELRPEDFPGDATAIIVWKNTGDCRVFTIKKPVIEMLQMRYSHVISDFFTEASGPATTPDFVVVNSRPVCVKPVPFYGTNTKNFIKGMNPQKIRFYYRRKGQLAGKKCAARFHPERPIASIDYLAGYRLRRLNTDKEIFSERVTAYMVCRNKVSVVGSHFFYARLKDGRTVFRPA